MAQERPEAVNVMKTIVMPLSFVLLAACASGTGAPRGSQTATSDAGGACILVPAAERDLCPLQRSATIGTAELSAPVDPRGKLRVATGAVVYMAAAPGLTEQWLSHTIACYQSRAAIRAHSTSTCPLDAPDLAVAVTSIRDGFAVSMRPANSSALKEVIESSQRLASLPPSSM